jgi:hypothetical protein
MKIITETDLNDIQNIPDRNKELIIEVITMAEDVKQDNTSRKLLKDLSEEGKDKIEEDIEKTKREISSMILLMRSNPDNDEYKKIVADPLNKSIRDYEVDFSDWINVIRMSKVMTEVKDRYEKIIEENETGKKGKGFKKRTKPVKQITPQRLELLIKGYQTGNTSEIIKKEIIMGLNQMIKKKVLTKKEVERIRNNILL